MISRDHNLKRPWVAIDNFSLSHYGPFPTWDAAQNFVDNRRTEATEQALHCEWRVAMLYPVSDRNGLPLCAVCGKESKNSYEAPCSECGSP